MQINLCVLNVNILEICKPVWKEGCFLALYLSNKSYFNDIKMNIHDFHCLEMLMIMLWDLVKT